MNPRLDLANISPTNLRFLMSKMLVSKNFLGNVPRKASFSFSFSKIQGTFLETLLQRPGVAIFKQECGCDCWYPEVATPEIPILFKIITRMK